MPRSDPSSFVTLGWTDGEGGWGSPMNLNLLHWFATTKSVISRTTTVPASGSAIGESYITPSTESTSPNQIQIWDGESGLEAFVAIPLISGLTVYVEDEDRLVTYNGTSWVPSGEQQVIAEARMETAPSSSQVVMEHLLEERVAFPANLPDFVKNIGTPPAGSMIFNVAADNEFNEENFGTMTIGTDGAVSFSNGDEVLGAGTVLRMTAPAAVDASLADALVKMKLRRTTDTVTRPSGAPPFPSSTLVAFTLNTMVFSGGNLTAVTDASGNGETISISGSTADITGTATTGYRIDPTTSTSVDLPTFGTLGQSSGNVYVALRVRANPASDTNAFILGINNASNRYHLPCTSGSALTTLDSGQISTDIIIDGVTYNDGSDTRDQLYTAIFDDTDKIIYIDGITGYISGDLYQPGHYLNNTAPNPDVNILGFALYTDVAQKAAVTAALNV